MNRRASLSYVALVFSLLMTTLGSAQTAAPAASKFTPQEGEYILRDFHFQSGETLPELRMHYATLGKPVRDASGREASLGRLLRVGVAATGVFGVSASVLSSEQRHN